MLKHFFIIGFFLLTAIGFSQEKERKLSEGNKLSDEYAYFKAIDVYEKVASQGYKSVELFQKLGDAYFFNAEYTKAYQWYSELFKVNAVVDPIYYYRYSQTLKSVGEIEKSDEYLKQFSMVNMADSRSVQYKGNPDYLQEIEDNSNRYTIENSKVNTPFSDYGGTIVMDKFIFTSSRMPDEGKNPKDNWTYDYFSSLFSSSLSKEGFLSEPQAFAREIQTKFHESDPVFTKDGKTMYFTKTNDSKKSKNTKKSIKDNKSNIEKLFLKIYKATLINGKWGNIIELPFNNDGYNCAHPILSADEKTMYFVSNMPGGYGDSDIYKVAITGIDKFGTPENLGKNINTQGKETFPTINNDELYFASDGHLGLGGLDLFVTNIQYGNYTSDVINLGRPINSEFDDFSFLKLPDSKLGFFTSNRDGGMGKDDIYSFVELEPLILTTKIAGQVIDQATQEPIPNVVITVYDENHKLIANTVTDANGRSASITDNKPKGKTYYVRAESVGYDSQELTIDSKTTDLEKGFALNISKTKKALEVGEDLAKTLGIDNGVLFDLNKYNVREDAEVELQKIVQTMKDSPEIEIEIRAYTDSRHTHVYNRKLSRKRARATKDYLVKNGISRSRIDKKAFGETNLLNHCEDGVICSEAEHQVNRRCEFVVTKSE